jgi:hypothetical protein
MKSIIVALFVTALTWSRAAGALRGGQAASQSPARSHDLLTIVVLDTSGSMEGERLNTAVAEIKQHARALPPSADAPWLCLPFRDTVYNPRRFTNGMEELQTYLDGLKAGGGTSIASGLEAALKAIRDANPKRVNILLYTDGEDDDESGIGKQQERLEQLFDERAERGLGQAVICRRWGGANKQFVEHLEKKKSVRVIDAGEARLLSLILTPEVRCLGTRWLPDRQALGIRLQATVQAPAEPIQQFKPAPLHFVCTTPQVQGDVAFDVAIGDAGARQFTIVLPCTPDGGRLSVRLDFEVSAPPAKQLAQTLVFPSLAKDRLSVVVDVPIVCVTPTTLATTRPQWVNLAQGTAAFEASVRIRVDGPLRDHMTLGLVAPPGVRSVQCRPALLHNGEQTVTVVLVAVLRPSVPNTLTFNLQPHPIPDAWHLHVPRPLEVQVTGPAPVRIALAQGGQAPATIEADLPSDGSPALANLRPVVIGAVAPGAARGLTPTVRAAGDVEFADDPRWTFARDVTVRLRPRGSTAGRSFFRDHVLEGSVVVDSLPLSPSVTATTQKVVLRSEAPFRKVLFIASIAFFGLVVLFVLARFLWKMTAG